MITMIIVNSHYALFADGLTRSILSNAHWSSQRSPWTGKAVILIVTAVSSWIIGFQMRRKIKKDLGRKAKDLDLTSVDTWMKVDEVENEHERNNPLEKG